MATLTVRSGTSRTINQRFITSGFFEFSVVASNAASIDAKVCGGCFKTGDAIGLCPSTVCQPTYTPGQCPSIISVTTPDSSGCSVLTIAGLSLPKGSTGSMYTVPALKGMWLALDFEPCLGPNSMTGPIRAVASTPNFIVQGAEHLAVGQNLIGNGIVQGVASVLSTRIMTDTDGAYFTLLTLDKPALINTICQDLRTFGIQGNLPIQVKGPRAKNSKGQGVCGGLQIEINKDISTAIARWGVGCVGTWKLTLNNGFSQNAATSSDLLNEGDLWVA